jgi:hypothetical protein
MGRTLVFGPFWLALYAHILVVYSHILVIQSRSDRRLRHRALANRQRTFHKPNQTHQDNAARNNAVKVQLPLNSLELMAQYF